MLYHSTIFPQTKLWNYSNLKKITYLKFLKKTTSLKICSNMLMVSLKITLPVVIFKKTVFLNLLNKHLPEGLKAFHLNIVSFKKNGVPLSYYLKSLNTIFDIICLTEIRQYDIGMFQMSFQTTSFLLTNLLQF